MVTGSLCGGDRKTSMVHLASRWGDSVSLSENAKWKRLLRLDVGAIPGSALVQVTVTYRGAERLRLKVRVKADGRSVRTSGPLWVRGEMVWPMSFPLSMRDALDGVVVIEGQKNTAIAGTIEVVASASAFRMGGG